MKSILAGALSVFIIGAATASAQPKPAPTLKSILVEQLKTSHNVQDWFVPASKAVEGLTFEQAAWKQGKDNHSVAQLVHHLTFWDKEQLAKFKGEKPPAFSGNNEETFFIRVELRKRATADVVVHFHQPVERQLAIGLAGVNNPFVHAGIPLAELSLAGDAPLAFQIKVIQDGIELERYPESAPIQFPLLGQDFALRNWIV